MRPHDDVVANIARPHDTENVLEQSDTSYGPASAESRENDESRQRGAPPIQETNVPMQTVHPPFFHNDDTARKIKYILGVDVFSFWSCGC